MLKIRLARVGKSNSPFFRLVVAEKSRAVKRQNLEILGLYNPISKDNKFQVNKERVLYWIHKGAQPSPTANNLLCDFDVLPKNKKVKNTFAKPEKKKEIKAKEGKKSAVAAEEVEVPTESTKETAEKTEESTVETKETTQAEAKKSEEVVAEQADITAQPATEVKKTKE